MHTEEKWCSMSIRLCIFILQHLGVVYFIADSNLATSLAIRIVIQACTIRLIVRQTVNAA
jgi:hypothetical protein